MIDTSNFEKVDEFGPVEKHTRDVDVPVGADSEAETQTVYTANGHTICVRRLSTLGWTLSHWDESGTLVHRVGSHEGYFEDEPSAHESARQRVESVV